MTSTHHANAPDTSDTVDVDPPESSDTAPPIARTTGDGEITRDEQPLTVLLDRLALLRARQHAAGQLVDGLLPIVTRRAIEWYDDSGIDRYRRPMGSTVSLVKEADRVELDPDPDALLLSRLVGAGVDTDELHTFTPRLRPVDHPQALHDALAALRAYYDSDADHITSAPLRAILDALTVDVELSPALVLAACKEHLGATVTRDGTVVADTGEPIEGIRVVRGRPTGVQVRNDAELKRATMADVLADVVERA